MDNVLHTSSVPIIGCCAYSGTGKTTLLAKVIPLLKAQGLKLAIVKHGHHSIDIDKPGKDSHTYREVGAEQVVLASNQRIAVMHERQQNQQAPTLHEVIKHVDMSCIDLILVEGFKHEDFPKIELCRPSLGLPLLYPKDANVVAIASNAPLSEHSDYASLQSHQTPTLLDLNQPKEVAHFIRQYVQQYKPSLNNG